MPVTSQHENVVPLGKRRTPFASALAFAFAPMSQALVSYLYVERRGRLG